MSEWKEFKLAQFIEFGNGKERPKTQGSIPVFGGNGVLGYCDRFNYDGQTIIIGRVGAYCGSVYYQETPIWVSDNALAAKPKNNYNAKFLYYFLKVLDLNSFAEGSSHPLVTQRLLNSLDVFITDNFHTQTSISELLSSLDDKIDLLHQQNKTLEQLAEIHFMERLERSREKWKEQPLSSLIETTLGGEWGKEQPEGEFTIQVCCIRGTDIADLQSGLAVRTPVRFVKPKKFANIQPQDGDLILEISGGTDDQSTGRTIYINELNRELFPYPLVFSNFCRLLRPVKKEFSFFLYLYLQYLYKKDEFFNLENGSSGIKNLDYKYLLYDLKFMLPTNNKDVVEFDLEVKSYFDKIDKNKHQIRTLTQLRDTLLPKLMSGEVRVKL